MKQPDKGIFYFKQFKIRHDQCGHKVGTDSILLGSWANLSNANTILDIGSGSGILMLMAAQRSQSNVRIEGVEPDADSARQSEQNLKESKWSSRLTVHQISIQNFSSAKMFDVILSNPPYFQNSLPSPNTRRHMARHDTQLNFEELIEACDKLSHSKSRLNIILPVTEGELAIKLAKDRKWFLTRKCAVRSRSHNPAERFLLEFCKEIGTIEETKMHLVDNSAEWSASIKKLTQDFYLKG